MSGLSLREKQSLFCSLVADLLIYAIDDLGFAVTFGETYRSPEEAARLAKLGKGIKHSLHTQRLAIDLNLFRDGVYLTSTEAHRPLGEWWGKQHRACRWGGRFRDARGRPKPDGNHYEMDPNAFSP